MERRSTAALARDPSPQHLVLPMVHGIVRRRATEAIATSIAAPAAQRTLKLTGDLSIANAAHSLFFDSFAA